MEQDYVDSQSTLPWVTKFPPNHDHARRPWTVEDFLTDVPGIRSRQHLSAACIPKMPFELE